MGWKNWPSWLNGGLIGSILLALLGFLALIAEVAESFGSISYFLRGIYIREIFNFLSYPLHLIKGIGFIIYFIWPLGIIVNLIYGFIIGAIIGWIIGKIKSKKQPI